MDGWGARPYADEAYLLVVESCYHHLGGPEQLALFSLGTCWPLSGDTRFWIPALNWMQNLEGLKQLLNSLGKHWKMWTTTANLISWLFPVKWTNVRFFGRFQTVLRKERYDDTMKHYQLSAGIQDYEFQKRLRLCVSRPHFSLAQKSPGQCERVFSFKYKFRKLTCCGASGVANILIFFCSSSQNSLTCDSTKPFQSTCEAKGTITTV